MKKCFILACILLLALMPRVYAQSPDNQKTLAGIKAVDVLVSELPEEIERDGLTKSQIKTDVELRLRKSGITVSTSAVPFVLVRVVIIKTSPARGYAYFLAVELRQLVEIPRMRNERIWATTWERGNLATIPLDSLREVRSDIADFVDAFINDYLAANPKQ